jgi:GNAT superfamily N-acetyltransferase
MFSSEASKAASAGQARRPASKIGQLPGARFPMSITDGYLLMRRSLSEPAPTAVLPEGTELVPLAAADAGRIHSLLQFSYAPGFGSVRPDALGWWEALVTDSEFDRNLCFVVKSGDRVVGFCLVWTSSFVKDFVVDGSFRRRGIGSAMLSKAIEAMRQRGAPEIALKVDMYNATAQRLYAEFGFTTE